MLKDKSNRSLLQSLISGERCAMGCPEKTCAQSAPFDPPRQTIACSYADPTDFVLPGTKDSMVSSVTGSLLNGSVFPFPGVPLLRAHRLVEAAWTVRRPAIQLFFDHIVDNFLCRLVDNVVCCLHLKVLQS